MHSSSKIIDTIFKVWIISLCGVMPLLRDQMIFCNQDISKTMTVMSLKLGQLIEDNKKITYWKLQKSYFIFSKYCPL